MKTRSIKKDIAIIGMSGKFPKSNNILEFWKNLVEGNELIHFYSDSELESLGVNPTLIKNKKYIKNSSFLEDSGSFDYSFFGYTKEEAELMDPQIRIIHEQAWLSLEDSGYNSFDYRGKIGCFFTASDNLIWRAHTKFSENSINVNPFLIESISNQNSINALVSYSLNLKGPSYFVDTACSSSLVAVHIAVRSLLLKECSMALAGGVSVKSSADIGYLHEEGMIYSKDGHCKAFDIDSSGTVKGEGVGVVVLKRLEDALNDRDHIYSIIRASSVNNDGNRKIGYTAPSMIGQYECVKSAHQIAEVDPGSISYIEAHGTGTKLGDSVEVEALNKAFNFDTRHQCAIGSLKTNIGHLDAAAGIAGLIKTALSLHNKIIPPSLHFKEPNPEINFKSGPFYVNSELKPWLGETPLIAGVSSFGIGGTNAHVLLEESPVQVKTSKLKSHYLIVYSAKTKSSIEKYHNKLKDFLKKNKHVDLADLSYTLKTGRSSFKYRNFFVCNDIDDARNQLDKISSNEPFQAKERNGVVFMFSGQGSQYFAMAKQIYIQFPYFKSIMDKGLAILKNETGKDYESIIGYIDTESESDLINDTFYTQPLLFLLEYALAKLLLNLGVKPSNMIGHSLGEYVAACISEVFSFEDGLKLVLKRAQLMNNLERGSMLSVDLTHDKVKEFISSNISIAAVNTENSSVISGNTESMAAISEILSSKEVSFVKLKTSHAFHSPMMDSILDAYEMELNKINFSEPKYPFISCVTGIPIRKEEAVSSKYWKNHLRHTVNFSQGLDFLLKGTYSAYIEVGPGKTLINFLRQNKNYHSGLVLASVLKHPKEIVDDACYLLNTLGVLWSCGIDINWSEYYSGESRNKISAPTYSFDKIIFPSKVNPIQKLMELGGFGMNNNVREDYSEWIYEQGWKEIKNELSRKELCDWTLCFLGDNHFSEKLQQELLKENENVIFIKQGENYVNFKNNVIVINPSNIEDYKTLALDVSERFAGTGRILHAWCAGNKIKGFNDRPETDDLGYFSLLNIARTFIKKKNFTSICLDFLVTDLFKVSGNEQISSRKSLALAALKIIPKEYENLHCKCIEFLVEDFEKNVSCRENLFFRLKINSNEEVIALRGKKAWEPFYEKIKVNKNVQIENKIKTNGLYVITGANGGMGNVIAEFLKNEHHANLILIGRSEENIDVINNLKGESNAVYYIQDDLSDLNVLNEKVKAKMNTFNGKVDGIFHAAGLGDYGGLIADRTKIDCQKIFLPKVQGTKNLFEVFRNYSPDFLVLCSSSSSVLSPFGQVAYVGANLFQNFFAQEHNSEMRIVSIQWDTWKERGMAVNARNRHGNRTANNILGYGISDREGIELFKYAINSKSPEIIVSINDFNAQLSSSSKHTLKKALELAEAHANIVDSEIERPVIKSIYREAQTEIEKTLCELWKSIFGYEKIGINDDFFELGGDSLKVMTLIKRIHKSFNIEISIGDFFKKSNIEELAKEIDLALGVKELNKSINQETKSSQIRL